MIILTDMQVGAVTDALRPLTPAERKGFCAELLECLLAHRDHYGDGELKRELARLQRAYFTPPSTEDVGWGPWRR
jgi:hypothetical protein